MLKVNNIELKRIYLISRFNNYYNNHSINNSTNLNLIGGASLKAGISEPLRYNEKSSFVGSIGNFGV